MEINPCPYCHDADNIQVKSYYEDNNEKYYIICTNCHATSSNYLNPIDAIINWNRLSRLSRNKPLSAAEKWTILTDKILLRTSYEIE